jgi:hypothetical protein
LQCACMDARRPTDKWTWHERLWLLAFAATQLAGLWQCFGAWILGSLVSHGG